MYVRINKKARKPVNSNWARIERYKDFKNAFSLMEMMVVLLIVAILAAATAPMVTKKMARNAGSGDSPWVFTGLNNDIAYNLNGASSTAIIGATSYRAGTGPAHPRLVLANGEANQPALAFANRDGSYLGQIVWDNTKVAMNNATMGNNSVAFGMGQTINNVPTNIVAIGHGVTVEKNDAIAIGSAVSVKNGYASIAIGHNAFIDKNPTKQRYFDNLSSAIAIGTSTCAANSTDIAIGSYSRAMNSAIAIGNDVDATHEHSVAIGYKAETTAPDQIVLGRANDTVYIKGNLVALGNVVLGSAGKKCIVYAPDNERYGILRKYSGNNNGKERAWYSDEAKNSNTLEVNGSSYNYYSDRRLKNVGEAYTAGLEELKKLDFFHYTFKKDEAKTPHVGVMAQDLQKVFPDAVTKGEDGYLQIRMEDMFYAVINAVKELDTKITEIVENVTSLSKKVDEQQQVIDAQQKLIEELQAQNAEFEKRLTKIEKKAK